CLECGYDRRRGAVDTLSRYTNAGSLQAVGIEKPGVVGRDVRRPRAALPSERDRPGRWIAAVVADALDDTQSHGSIGDGTAMRPDRILGMGDRHHTGATRQTHGRFDTHHAVGIGGTNDAAVGLGAERYRGKVSRHTGAGSGARAARVAIDAVGIVSLPAHCRPAADRGVGTEIRPLG